MNSNHNLDRLLLWGVAQLDIRYFSILHTKFYILVHYFCTIKHTLMLMFLILNHRAPLLTESNAFSKSTTQQYTLPLFTLKYLSTDVLIIKLLYTVHLPLVKPV